MVVPEEIESLGNGTLRLDRVQMNRLLPAQTTIRYAVPELLYWTDVSVPLTKEGYSTVSRIIRRNAGIALALKDRERFARFRSDGQMAVKIFLKAKALTRNEAAGDMAKIDEWPRTAVVETGLEILGNLIGVVNPDSPWKKALAGFSTEKRLP
jgi:hypothetical protein